MFPLRRIFISSVALPFFFLPTYVIAAEDDLQQQIDLLKTQVTELEAKLLEQKQQEAQAKQSETQQAEPEKKAETSAEKSDGISVGGAIRTNFSYTSYSEGNEDRGGDFDFDIFRFNLNGNIGAVSLNAEIRFYDYMTAVKNAYVAYQFTDLWQVQAGIAQVPFGNLPYNSHNYFFSTNYYIGLEDDHDLGLVFKRSLSDNWQLDLGFFKNDELGGIDGYVDSRADRYSYDVVGYRLDGDGIYDDPAQPLGEYNTFTGRFAYVIEHATDFTTELGVSGLSGGLHDDTERAGSYSAWAIHLNSKYNRWNLQLEHGEYDYSIDDAVQMAVGAYAFYDSIAAQATTSTINLAYSLPVSWGPVTGLQFYNNYGLIYDKADGTRDTMMNVTGVSVSAGGLFTYFDLVHARNQPFVGGSVAGDSSETERRFNINIGYYF